MRRLPIFFLLDVSDSMVGDNLRKMEEGLSSIVRTLRQNPDALETVHIAVIAFAGVARTIVPLVELVAFCPPKLPLGSGTALGAALMTLMREIDGSIIKTTAEVKGDWKPIVYLFTDGRPTDDVSGAVSEWTRKYTHKAHVVAVAMGHAADPDILRQATDNVILYEGSSPEDFKKFINWVTASVSAQSQSATDGTMDGVKLAKLDESVLKSPRERTAGTVDGDCVTLTGRCSQTRRPYVIKYDRVPSQVLETPLRAEGMYFLVGTFPVEESYFDWSTHQTLSTTINTSNLIGTPGCPHCGNLHAFAMCGCGHLLCLAATHLSAVCPWCQKSVRFESGGDFDVERSQG